MKILLLICLSSILKRKNTLYISINYEISRPTLSAKVSKVAKGLKTAQHFTCVDGKVKFVPAAARIN
jgi:hypothetical protein